MAENHEISNPENQTKRWLMFLLRPADVLELLHIISNPKTQFAAASLPPDVQIVANFWDETRGFLGLMLESEFFEPVAVHHVGGQLVGDYPRAVLSFAQQENFDPNAEDLWGEDNDESAMRELHRRENLNLFEGLQNAAARDFRVRGLNFSASDLLLILRAKSVVELPVFPLYPREVRVLGVAVHEKPKIWTIFLEHPDFPPAKLSQNPQEEMVFVEFESDGHDLELRIGLPGAQLTRKISLDVDELENS